MIPEDDRNLYHCSEQPRHLSVAVEKFNWGLPYGDYFGGVTLFSRRLVQLINGASNFYFGWGGEGARLSSAAPPTIPFAAQTSACAHCPLISFSYSYSS